MFSSFFLLSALIAGKAPNMLDNGACVVAWT